MNGTTVQLYGTTTMSAPTKFPTTNYRPPEDAFQSGLEFQDYVVPLLYERGIVVTVFSSRRYQYEFGESCQGIEIKKDTLCTRTGQMSIEIAEKSSPLIATWTPSGIYRHNGWGYVQGNERLILLFATEHLRELHKSGRFEEHETPTVKGFFLPISEARRRAVLVVKG